VIHYTKNQNLRVAVFRHTGYSLSLAVPYGIVVTKGVLVGDCHKIDDYAGWFKTEAGRGEHAQGFFQNLVKFILPLPEQFSNLILKDAMNHERVSYPGFMAKLGEYKNNVYAIRFGPFIRNAFLLVLALGAWVMKRKEKMDGKLLNKKYPNV
jgi:hypothetical protein